MSNDRGKITVNDNADGTDFKDANVPDDTETPETAPAEDPDEQYIVHRAQFQDSNGVWQTKEHRVKLSEWAKYEKENGL